MDGGLADECPEAEEEKAGSFKEEMKKESGGFIPVKATQGALNRRA